VPSLDEQNRIGQVISKSSSILSLRRDSLFAVNKLERSLFLDMFGDPIANPKNWEICKLGHLIKKIETGKNIKPVEDGTLDGFRVLKLSAVTKGVFKPEESKPLSDDYTPPESHFVKEGDFLFGRANTTELVGAVALVEEEHPNLLLPDKIWRINWDVNKVTNEYMYSLFWTESFKRKLGSISSGTGGSMKNISQGKFLELLVPLPPMEIQARFVEKVHSIKKYKKNLLVSSNRFQVLQSSLISKYFP
jgi:type I restriction enzyme S subunit